MKHSKLLAKVLAGTALAGMAVTGFAPQASAETLFNDGDILSLTGSGFILAVDTTIAGAVGAPVFCGAPRDGREETFGTTPGTLIPCAYPDEGTATVSASEFVVPPTSGFVPFANVDGDIFSLEYNGNFTPDPGGPTELKPFTPFFTPEKLIELVNGNGDVLEVFLTTVPFDPTAGGDDFLNLTAEVSIVRTDANGDTQTVPGLFEFTSEFFALAANVGSSFDPDPDNGLPYGLTTDTRDFSLTITVVKAPEPGTVAGLALVASLGAGRLLRNKKKNLD